MTRQLCCFAFAYCILAPSNPGANAEGQPPGSVFGNIAGRFDAYDVVVRPDKDAAEWWAGAPSVARGDDGTFWLAARMRTAEAPLGKRGYEIRIFRSKDGVHFDQAASIHRKDVPLPGFERPMLMRDPLSGKFKLYACGPLKGPWSIFKFADADSPDQFDPKTARPVIEPLREWDVDPNKTVGVYARPAPVPGGYKDAVVLFADGKFHAYVIGVIRSTERTYHFISDDGEKWSPVGNPSKSILDLAGWHDFAVRPASILPMGAGYLFVYEGSSTAWNDPVYNIATGLGFSFDLHTIKDLTPDAPLVRSSTPGRLAAWRYSHWIWVGDALWVYAEVENKNGSHEIRRFVLQRK